ncbi:MAG: S-methyl-5-thioribose kinase [Steroidobacteraceae bacterium]
MATSSAPGRLCLREHPLERVEMAGADASDDYPLLDLAGARDYAAALEPVRERLGASPEQWRVREVGDGNLNLVFIAEGPDGSVCIKQALPYVRAAGPSWPMTPERAFFEYSYYQTVAPHVGELIPQILHYDSRLHCLLMERLAPHIILRRGLIDGRCYPDVGRALGEYIARASFFTSDLAAPFERKMESMALFARNTPLVRITVDLVFTDPYRTSPRNRHTSPELDAAVADLRSDGALKAAAARFGHKFLSAPQALIHGDLHSGSVMVTPQDSRVIDPEFAFYGPIGFDLGAFFGNLLLAWYAQPGHEASDGERAPYRDWILDEAQRFWESFQTRFLALWQEKGRGDAYPAPMFANAADAAALGAARRAFIDALFADMLGFAACKMIRRIVGFAHVLDFESITDRRVRARCEAGALALAGRLLTEPERFGSIGEVIEAVRGDSLRSQRATDRV